MLKRLFKKKDKIQEIEEMILHLKVIGKLDALGGIGRDWYSEKFLMRADKKPTDDYIIKNGDKFYGPYHNKQPRGEGLKMGTGSGTISYITYSSIPIHHSNYDWARIECNRLEDGYYNKDDIKFINFIQSKYNPKLDMIPVNPTKSREQSVHRPGLERLYRRAIYMQQIEPQNEMWDKQIKIYEYQMECAAKDSYGRVYNYFVIKMRPKIDNSKILPNILSRNNDYDKDWHVDPMFETDDLHNILDTALKKHIIEIGQKFVKNTNIRIDRQEIKHNIDHVIASNEYECQTMARTVAITRAKPTNSEIPYRLNRRDYNPNIGIDIPENYFDFEKPKDKNILSDNERYLKNENNVSFFENFEKKKYWPETTREDYIDSLNKYKGTAIIFSYHIRDLLIKMKKYVFADNNMYMNEIKCDPKVFCKLKEWYEHCITMLVPEMIEFVQYLKPEHGEYEPKPFLFKHSEAHKFKKAGPRIRTHTPTRRGREGDDDGDNNDSTNLVAVRNPNIMIAQPAVVQNIINNPNIQEIADAQPTTINESVRAEIDAYNNGNQYQLNRLINIMEIPIWIFNNMYPQTTTRKSDIPQRTRWDFQRWHRKSNTPAWNKIKALCNLWDTGQLQEVDDPRKTLQGLWFMKCLGQCQNDSNVFIPGAWPSNEVIAEVPPDGASVYDVYESNEEKNDEWPESRKRLEKLILISLPAILSILHHAFIWNVSLPVEEYDGKLILYPGCEWFKKMVLSLLNSNEYVPILSPYVNAWFISPEAKLSDSILLSSGYTKDGYINNKKQVFDSLESQMKEMSKLWVDNKESTLQVGLSQLLNMTPKSALHTFSQQNFMSNYINFMNEQYNLNKEVGKMTRNRGRAAFQDSQASRMLEGQAILYQNQINLWEGMLWVCGYIGILFLGYLATGIEVSNEKIRQYMLKGLTVIQYGAIPLFSIGKVTWDTFQAPKASNFPKYVASLNKAWYFSNIMIVSHVIKSLWDDSVEKENEFRVQKYYGVRNEWWNRIYDRSNENDNSMPDLNIKKSMWDLIRLKTYEFIQISRRFKDEDGFDSVLVKNKKEQTGGNALIHFDIRYPSFYFKNRELESKSRARNIHYPPGTIFKSKEEYIVVDDLQTMYTYPCQENLNSLNPLDILKTSNQFPGFDWDKTPENWSISDNFRKNLVNYTNQFRLAVSIKNKKLVLVSVADKNFVKSLKKTSLIASTGILAMCIMDADNTNELNNTLTNMGLIGLGTSAALENTQTALPIIGIGLSAYKSCPVTQAPILKPMPRDMIANTLIVSSASAWYLYNNKRIVSEKRYNRILVDKKMSLLIPLSLTLPKIFGENRTLWGGKLWCPITGRLFYFEQKHDRNDYFGIGKLNNKSRKPIKFFFIQNNLLTDKYVNIEDGFELRKASDGKIELIISCIRMDYPNHFREVIGTWIYTPSPISKHAWFIKIN